MSESFFYDNTIESELAKSGVYASVTKGNSMRPLFKTNRDMIILKTPDGELKKYDVALYRTRSGKYVLHRVVGVRGDIYLVRGDNTFVLAEFNRNGKKYTVNSSSYKLYSRVWNFIYPARYLFHFARSFAYRVYRKLFKKGA